MRIHWIDQINHIKWFLIFLLAALCVSVILFAGIVYVFCQLD